MISSPSLSISPLTPTLHHNASTSPSLMTSLWRNRKNSVSLWAQLTPASPLFLPPLMSPSPMKIVRSLSSLLWFNQCCNFIKNTSPTPLLEESCVLEVCHPPLWEAVIRGHIFCELCFPCFKIWNLNMLFWLSISCLSNKQDSRPVLWKLHLDRGHTEQWGHAPLQVWGGSAGRQGHKIVWTRWHMGGTPGAGV